MAKYVLEISALTKDLIADKSPSVNTKRQTQMHLHSVFAIWVYIMISMILSNVLK